MATQGLISIVENGRVIMKVVCGCNGYNVKNVAKIIEDNYLENIQEIYNIAFENRFGCSSCLVVMNESDIIYKGDDDISSYPLYRETFSNPFFNPRWKCGSIENLVIIERKEKKIDINITPLEEMNEVLKKIKKLIDVPEKDTVIWSDAFYTYIDNLRQLLNSKWWLKGRSVKFNKKEFKWFLDDNNDLVVCEG